MEYGLALIVLAALVAVVVLPPIIRGTRGREAEPVVRAELLAAKEAKYREIRDARLDLEMGKLSKDDHLAIDRELRREAIEILQRIDALDGRDAPA